MRRFAFLGGLILGGSATAWLLGSALCYAFTGKLPTFRVGPDRRPRLSLVDVEGLYETPLVVPAADRGEPRGWSRGVEAV